MGRGRRYSRSSCPLQLDVTSLCRPIDPSGLPHPPSRRVRWTRITWVQTSKRDQMTHANVRVDLRCYPTPEPLTSTSDRYTRLSSSATCVAVALSPWGEDTAAVIDYLPRLPVGTDDAMSMLGEDSSRVRVGSSSLGSVSQHRPLKFASGINSKWGSERHSIWVMRTTPVVETSKDTADLHHPLHFRFRPSFKILQPL